jgi:hypothetical protein
MRIGLSFLRTLAGVTSAIVPFAIAVHLFAEGLALGAGVFAADFWLRHVYLLAPLALALWSFSRTVGLGAGRTEMIRRCAFVRARLRAGGGASTIAAFTVSNLLFFGVTQVLEGVPIATTSIGTGLTAAVLGALLSALAIFFWGRSIVATALAAAARRPRLPARLAPTIRRIIAAPRTAATTFSLFAPKRPPPVSSAA